MWNCSSALMTCLPPFGFRDRPRGIHQADVTKACGKLPSSYPVFGSTSSASRPTRGTDPTRGIPRSCDGRQWRSWRSACTRQRSVDRVRELEVLPVLFRAVMASRECEDQLVVTLQL